MLFIKHKLNNINKRVKILNDKSNRIILEFVTDLEGNNNYLYHILRVVNSNNQVLYTKEVNDDEFLGKCISDLSNKYNCSLDYEFYNIVNNHKIKTF